MRRHLTILIAATALASCGAATTAVPVDSVDTVPGVGSLPEDLRIDPVDAVPAGTIVPRVTVERSEVSVPVSERVTGNRLLVIGDSIFASMSRRYGGELCDTLVPLGWDVEVNAEVGRFVEFAGVVVERRLRPEAGVDWDAAVITLGSNFGGDVEAYRARLLQALDRLEPRPVVLVTVSEFRADRAQVNQVMRDVARFYAEVRVLEWGETTRAEPALLLGDGLHLSDAGRERLASDIAVELGTPGDDVGTCLATSFTDDSAIASDGSIGVAVTTPPPTTQAAPSTTTTAVSAASTTAANPATTAGTTGGTTGGSGATTSTTSGATTSTSVATTDVATTIDPGSSATTTAAPTTVVETTAATTTPGQGITPTSEPPSSSSGDG